MQPVLVGTAQWGLDYGVTNASGRADDEAVRGIARFVRDHGLAGLDTAAAYGDSEVRIGALAPNVSVQTKVSAQGLDAPGIRRSIGDGLRRLQRERVASILVHDWSRLSAAERAACASALRTARADGLVDRVGISVYSAEELANALDGWSDLDVVQVPASVLDQRIIRSDEVSHARDRGIVVQARSVFLQGVALGGPSPWRDHPDVLRLVSFASAREVSPMTVCLSYIQQETRIDEVVVGFARPSELEEFWALWITTPPLDDVVALASDDTTLLDPRVWS